MKEPLRTANECLSRAIQEPTESSPNINPGVIGRATMKRVNTLLPKA